MQEAQETSVKSLAREDPLEEEMATHSSIDWKIPSDRGAWWATVHEVGQDWAHTNTHTHAASREFLELISGVTITSA